MPSDVNKIDPEECEACEEADNLCLYHEGVEAGQRMAFRLIEQVASDPEAAALAYARYRRHD